MRALAPLPPFVTFVPFGPEGPKPEDRVLMKLTTGGIVIYRVREIADTEFLMDDGSGRSEWVGREALFGKWLRDETAAARLGAAAGQGDMSNTDDLLAPFVFDSALDWWEAELAVPLWGERLTVVLEAPAVGPSPRQVETLRAVLGYPESLRGPVAEALLAHYRDEWGGITPSLGRAPALQSADEVWAAMSGFALYIPAFRSMAETVAFEVHMDSRWDEDHGLCVLIQDWVVTRVAGQTDCHGADA